MTDSVHAAARQGFERQAEAYARGRPGYPPELRGWLATALGLGPGRAVADVGAGTGKFTRLLAATGAAVTAIEPVDAMRARISAGQTTVRSLAGTAQALPLEDGSVDAIVCAQAFHWFATGATLDEFARVLKPGGRLGLVWNVRDESLDWVAALTRIITPYEGDTPRFYKGTWRQAFPHPAFGPLRETVFEQRHEGAPEHVIIDRFMSVSFIAALPAHEQASVHRRLQDVIDHHPALRGRARIALPYHTRAFITLRR